jgi:hypothetical protein
MTFVTGGKKPSCSSYRTKTIMALEKENQSKEKLIEIFLLLQKKQEMSCSQTIISLFLLQMKLVTTVLPLVQGMIWLLLK